MAVEVACGSCGGGLLVERPNEVVMCPHCGAELMLGASDLLPGSFDSDLTLIAQREGEAPSEHPGQRGDPTTIETPVDSLDELTPATGELPEGASSTQAQKFALPAASIHDSIIVSGSGSSVLDEAETAGQASLPRAANTQLLVGESPAEESENPQVITLVPEAVPQEGISAFNTELPNWEPAEPVQDVYASEFAVHTEALTAEAAVPLPESLEISPNAPSVTPAISPSPSPSMAKPQPATQTVAAPPVNGEVVPKLWFVVAASYASAATLFILYSLFLAGPRTHELESLPDLVPPMEDGRIGLSVARPEGRVAPGHVLRLGESRRFGNVLVTPIKVTQGPLEYQHYDARHQKLTRPASQPVWKLWLKFENVSKDQSFSPLDSMLAYERVYRDNGTRVLTNNFLCVAHERKSGGDLRYLYDMPTESEWRIQGQGLGTVLAPGESCEIFLPSEEATDGLKGPIVWRVQFRKGYNPTSKRGVTTLIDVEFPSDAVKSDPQPVKAA